MLISTTIGKNNDNASFALKGFKLYYEKPDACATLYTECNYTGNIHILIIIKENHLICVKTYLISNWLNIQAILNLFKFQLVLK